MDTTVFICNNARFTLIRDGVLRMEYSVGGFVDEETLFAERNYLKNAKTVELSDEVVIETPLMKIIYTDDGNPFNAENLHGHLNISGKPVEWHYGDEEKGNLGGAVITLDGCDGKKMKIPDGIVSRDGWKTFDDSNTTIIKDSWIAKRPEGHTVDKYLFVYGSDYKKALRDLACVSGKTPLPRKYLLGSWYTRWYAYTADEFKEIVKEYNTHGFPIDVLAIDMDWHHNDWQTPEDHPRRAHYGHGHAGGNLGWTGYSWNEKFIPDPKGLIDFIHSEKLATTLNDHPADGIRDNETSYPEFAKALGLDEKNKENIPFKCDDKKYMEAFFKCAHGESDSYGVDFWWIDWQQDYLMSHVPGFENLPVLSWLNKLYFDNSKKENKRGAIYSRWGGIGSQKYPIYFSGDTVSCFDALKFEIENTVASSNSLCFWWAHDIGGFFSRDGEKKPELYVRWVQYGITSAALKLHSGSPKIDKRPWTWDEDTCEKIKKLYLLRSRLFPVIYSAAALGHFEEKPLNMPLYYEYPDCEEAYRHPTEYFLTENIICAPVYTEGEGDDKKVKQEIWLPEGNWYNFFTGEKFKGGFNTVESTIDTFPLLFKAGAPVPMQKESLRMASETLSELTLRIYAPEGDGKEEFRLYEDDGLSDGYLKEEYLFTNVVCTCKGNTATVDFIPTGKGFDALPKTRKVTIELVKEGNEISTFETQYETEKPHTFSFEF